MQIKKIKVLINQLMRHENNNVYCLLEDKQVPAVTAWYSSSVDSSSAQYVFSLSTTSTSFEVMRPASGSRLIVSSKIVAISSPAVCVSKAGAWASISRSAISVAHEPTCSIVFLYAAKAGVASLWWSAKRQSSTLNFVCCNKWKMENKCKLG